MLQKVYHKLHQLLPPEPCALCSKPAQADLALCYPCQQQLPILQHPPLDLLNRGLWHQIVIPYLYRDPLIALIQQLKFDHKLHLARLFGKLMEQKLLQGETVLPDLIIPIPLHHQRLRERGFNQAIEIIRDPSHSLGIPLVRTEARRTRSTPAQMGLDATERKTNLKGAFEFTGSFAGKHIALFDDVVTTGSTMVAATQAVKAAGATSVDLWALAYTPPHQ